MNVEEAWNMIKETRKAIQATGDVHDKLREAFAVVEAALHKEPKTK